MFIAAQFTIAKYWKQPKCPSANEWIKKLWYIYTMEFYAEERKKELIPFAMAWMELGSSIHGTPTLCDSMDATGEHYAK